MKLIITELKYTFFTIMIFSAVLILMAVTLTKPDSETVFRLNPIIFTLGILLYNLLYRKDEKNERLLVTLPVNIRLIPLLRYVTPLTFWLFSQVLFFTVANSIGLTINLMNEMIISIKVSGLLVILMSITFIHLDKFLEYGIKLGLKRLWFSLSLILIILFTILFSLLPFNVINKIGWQYFFFIKETIELFWISDLSLILISIISVFSVIINIELHTKKTFT